jgi:hypothetical protein
MPGSTTERRIVQLLNSHYEENNIPAYAHRLKQAGWSSQHIDLLSLSSESRYYLGVECKSAVEKDANKRPFTILYFSRYFCTTKDGHQVPRTGEYLAKTGLIGYLAMEIRARPKNHIYFIPFEVVEKNYAKGLTGLTREEIESYPDILDVGAEGVL